MQDTSLESIIGILLSGGWVMIPLFILAVILFTTAFDLLLSLRRGNLSRSTEAQWREWIAAPEKGDGEVGDIIRYTQAGGASDSAIRHRFEEVRSIIVTNIGRRLFFLNTLVAAAPLMGLLGTVIGMLTTFKGISTGGGETVDVVAGGISEALITTQTGLMIALPGIFIVLVVQRKRHSVEATIARLESLTLVRFSKHPEAA